MDLETLMLLLQDVGDYADMWKSDGIARLNPVTDENWKMYTQAALLGMINVLCKQPWDLDALRRKCKDIVNLSSDLFKSMQRYEGQDLPTAASIFKQ